jgi:hypothetical protein
MMSPTTTIASPPALSQTGKMARQPSAVVPQNTAKPSPPAIASSGTDRASWSSRFCQREPAVVFVTVVN